MKIYKIPTRYGDFYVRRTDVQSFQHPSEVAQGYTYEQCTPQGTIVTCTRMFTGMSEDDVIASGGVLVSD